MGFKSTAIIDQLVTRYNITVDSVCRVCIRVMQNLGKTQLQSAVNMLDFTNVVVKEVDVSVLRVLRRSASNQAHKKYSCKLKKNSLRLPRALPWRSLKQML